ncbi:MAG: hypothetical protein AAF432_09790 [Planctomycetota bacterium]
MHNVSTVGAVAALALTAAFMTGCETFTPPVKTHDVLASDGERSLHVVEFNSNRRSAYVFEHGDQIRVVAEPPPDTALKQALEGALKASVTQAGGSGEAKVKATLDPEVIARAISISLLRDASYRIAEAYANGAINESQYDEKFEQILFVAHSVALAEVTAKYSEAVKEAVKVKKQELDTMEMFIEQGGDPQLFEFNRTDSESASVDELIQQLESRLPIKWPWQD